MGFLINRIGVVSTWVAHCVVHGLPFEQGPFDREVLFILDGVGGFQFSPVMIRRALRQNRSTMGTIWYRWQFGLPGEIWTDLMWIRRNRVMGAQLARKILAFHRRYPQTTIHLTAFSGGAGIAAFACESLQRPIIETLLLGCPALSPTFNLAPALRCVNRAVTLISHKDRFLLGWGTTIFGTTDRKFGSAAGRMGFAIPAGLPAADRREYDKLRQIHWSPAFKLDGHHGGHTGWMNERFLAKHLIPLLHNVPSDSPSSLS